MSWNFLVIDFIIFTVAATVGFIFGAFWVDSEFEKDSYHLAAEVENLNEALDALSESYEQEVENGDKLFRALQRSIDAREAMKNGNQISPETQRKIREAWRESDRDIDLG